MASSSTRQATGPFLVSASRRGDIPRWYARWFAARRRAGFADYRTAFGVPGRASLRAGDVLGYVFWTRDARPFEGELRRLREEGVPYAMQHTLTAYGRELEPRRPSLEGALASFLRVREGLPGPEAIQWRYDPIVCCERYPASFHLEAFARIARRLRGATRVVNVSIVEPYRKALRRVADPTVRWREREAGEQARELAAALAALGAESGMEVRACCNPELGLPASQCVGAALSAAHPAAVRERVGRLAAGASRPGCRCLRSVDIGMDNTCPAGCRYCYVVSSDQSALANLRRHDPEGSALRRM